MLLRLAALFAAGAALLLAGDGGAAAAQLGEEDRRQPVVIASDPWCPYACNPKTDGRDGYMVDLARAVFEEAGLTVEYQVVNFQVMRRMALDGSATAIPGVVADLDGALLLPAVPQGNSANAVVVAKGRAFTWAGPDSFLPHRMAVIKDYNYGGAIQDYVQRHRDDPARIEVLSGFGYSHVTQGLRMVLAKRVDLFLDDRNVLFWNLQRLPPGDEVRVVSLQDDADLFIGLSKADPRTPALVQLLAEGTARMRQDGRLAKLLASYGLKDWAKR